MLTASEKIYIKQSDITSAGRGVFARRKIKKYEIIEQCPIIDIPEHDTANLKESILVTYFFFYGQDKKNLLLALGFGSIYNHSYKPNASYKIIKKERKIVFMALSDINKDKEIKINYKSGSLKNKNPLWLETLSADA
jgi:uncharacterized protein